jgi:CRP-like cAMP-binding protein
MSQDLVDRLLSPVAAGRNCLLTSLPSPEFSLLAPHLSERTFVRGGMLQEAGTTVDHVYFPHSGLISLLLPMAAGQSVELALIGCEGAIGLSAAMGSPVALNTAVYASAGTAARISVRRLAGLAEGSATLRALIVGYNDIMLAHVQQMAACNALHDVEARLCRWLMQASDRIGTREIMITQEQLSDLLCVRRTTVTLVCRGLQMAGIIHIRRGRVEISDIAALEQKACSCYGATRALTDELIERLDHAAP